MRARIVREFALESGIPVRRQILEDNLRRKDLEDLAKDADSANATWELQVQFEPSKNEDARDRAKYFVVIEEREARLPATYDNEPVGPALARGFVCGKGFDDALLVNGGPRFFAKIPI